MRRIVIVLVVACFCSFFVLLLSIDRHSDQELHCSPAGLMCLRANKRTKYAETAPQSLLSDAAPRAAAPTATTSKQRQQQDKQPASRRPQEEDAPWRLSVRTLLRNHISLRYLQTNNRRGSTLLLRALTCPDRARRGRAGASVRKSGKEREGGRWQGTAHPSDVTERRPAFVLTEQATGFNGQEIVGRFRFLNRSKAASINSRNDVKEADERNERQQVMVRTSRNGAPSANVDALDNLNLDDMFADEGDALFDGLDMDLGNMDDLAVAGGADGGGGASADGGAASAANLGLGAANAPRPPSSSAKGGDDDDESATGTRKRRKTKRKIKTPVLYEDDDDYVEESTKKKKRKTSAKAAAAAPSVASSAASSVTSTTKKKKKTGKAAKAAAAAAAASTAGTGPAKGPGSATKGKGAKGRAASVAMPPPGGRATSGGVAAAGQFGGRMKRGGASSISFPVSSPSRTSTKGKSSSVTGAASAVQRAAAAAAAGNNLAQIQATHPGLSQSTYCGMMPSNTLFYPFMPQLPDEAAFKHRKVVGQIDRLHTAFMNYTSINSSATPPAGIVAAKEYEPIFRLIQEAMKDDKPSAAAADAASNSQETPPSPGDVVGILRKMVAGFDKTRLAADLLAVCALLKRQHDFMKQNMSNMEQWCKSHLPDSEYQSVYAPPKSKKKAVEAPMLLQPRPSVLLSLKRSDVRIRIICTGYKESSKSKALVARLPPPFGGVDVSARPVKAAPTKTKKRKLSTASAAPVVAVVVPTAAPTAPAVPVAPKPLTYVDMKPAKRRKNMADLIARTARELEAKYLQRFDDQRQVLDRQQSDMRKLVEDDKLQVIHTTGMWKWFEKSGYFGRLTDSDIRWRLDGIISPDARTAASSRPSVVLKERHQPSGPDGDGEVVNSSSLVERLQSLLVDVDCSDDDDDGDDDTNASQGSDSDYLYDDDGDDALPAPSLSVVDMKDLTPDERLYLHLRSVGLVQSTALANIESKPPSDTALQGLKGEQDEATDELGDLISSMIADLSKVNDFNNRRTGFLESLAQAYLLSDGGPGKKAEEAALISKCQQLLKKNKDSKKNGKAKSAKNDDLALPW